MSIIQFAGAAMLATLFLALFVAAAREGGIVTALKTFGITSAICLWVGCATWLFVSGFK
jgi:hypothetical protein